MNAAEIQKILDAKVYNEVDEEPDVDFGYSCDLMSDVLAFAQGNDVGGVGHAGTSPNLPAEQVAPSESNAVTHTKLGIRDPCEGFPRTLGGQTRVGIVSVVADVVRAPCNFHFIRGATDLGFPFLTVLLECR